MTLKMACKNVSLDFSLQWSKKKYQGGIAKISSELWLNEVWQFWLQVKLDIMAVFWNKAENLLDASQYETLGDGSYNTLETYQREINSAATEF